MHRALRTAVQLIGFAICLQGTASRSNELAWHSGFENGFPGKGEWLDFDDGSYVRAGSVLKDRASGWTIVHRDSGEPVFAGDYAYKGWITGPHSASHRAYPVLHADLPTPLVNTFMAFIDVDYARMSRTDWVHLGTWGNNDAETGRGKWALHTLGIRERKLEFAHTAPFHGEYIGEGAQPDFPLRRWVRLTVYMAYEGKTGFVQVWQDGAPMLRARVSGLATNPGTRLRTAHWGMYAARSMDHGVQYNDEIRICTLKGPPADLLREPLCPPAPAP